MRFMMLVQLPVDTSARLVPDLADAARMQRYNEDLARAGVLLAGDGLHPPAEAVRLEFAAGGCQVLAGPYAGCREFVGGYWLLQASSKEEAVEWARRCPMRDGDAIELRRVSEECAAGVSRPERDPGTRASPAGAAYRRPRAG
jgi:hypothetical protein